ncbi:MAG: hypothetical protein LBJ13_02190 [Puniceicoccales bacterium]|nr:hypothetical protein [Puniceicoccales bacterium]
MWKFFHNENYFLLFYVNVNLFSLNKAIIKFKRPQRALSSGQVVAFYEGEVLLGGGIYV